MLRASAIASKCQKTAPSVTDHVLRTNFGSVFARVWTTERGIDTDHSEKHAVTLSDVGNRMQSPNDGCSRRAPIVLLHDSLGSVTQWRDFPALLSERSGRNVIAYDRLGFGYSEQRSDTLSQHFIADESTTVLAELVRHFQLDAFVAFGHSVGGPMAVECASHFPRSCVAVVTEAAQSFVGEETLEGIVSAKAAFEDPKQLERLAKYHGERAKWVLDAWTETWLDPRYATWSLRDVLPSVQAPVLVMHGDRDEFGSIRHPEMIAGLCGGHSELHILDNCGHVPHREHPERVIGLVVDFLERNVPC